MMTEYHVILVKNLAESFDENSDESFINFYFDFVVKNCCNDVDQNFYNVVKSYFFLSSRQIFFYSRFVTIYLHE